MALSGMEGNRSEEKQILYPSHGKVGWADNKSSKYFPEKLAEDFDMQPWVDSIFWSSTRNKIASQNDKTPMLFTRTGALELCHRCNNLNKL